MNAPGLKHTASGDDARSDAEIEGNHVARRRNRISSTRGLLYRVARILGDVQAVNNGRVGRRVGRRVAGRATGRGLGRLFR